MEGDLLPPRLYRITMSRPRDGDIGDNSRILATLNTTIMTRIIGAITTMTVMTMSVITIEITGTLGTGTMGAIGITA